MPRIISTMAHLHLENLRKWKRMTRVNWKNEEERFELLRQLIILVDKWEGELPNLRDIFRVEEMNLLLQDSLKCRFLFGEERRLFIEFVTRSGYKDEPKDDEDGKPLLHRTTAVHCAVRYRDREIISNLFKIYNRFDVNYTDDSGITHFHVACMYGFDIVVLKFLELGQDPNCCVPKTGDSPLHLAIVGWFLPYPAVIELLLRRGANPNLANKEGSTPLHIVCKKKTNSDYLVDMLFQYSKKKYFPAQVNAKDKLGRTPLQWAVAYLVPNVIEKLLNYGANLSSFVFPTESYFGERFDAENRNLYSVDFFDFRLVSVTLFVVERLKENKYKLVLSDALTIMRFFGKFGLFENLVDLDEFWYDDERFAREARKLMINSDVSLYDLVWLRSEQAEKKLTYKDYYKFMYTNKLCELPEIFVEDCALHLTEKLLRGFLRKWAVDCFRALVCYQLSLECCEMIIDESLTKKNLYNICLSIAV